MTFPPQAENGEVVTVESQGRPDGTRGFDPGDCPGSLRELVQRSRNESDLVEAMRGRGYRLTMVGGGAAPEDTRRLYFRRE